MDKKSKLTIAILSFILAISIKLNWDLYNTSSKFESAYKENKSLYEYQLKQQSIISSEAIHKADSISKIYTARLKQDSINAIKYKKKIAAIPHYAPAVRNAVFDSIFGKSY